MGICRSNSETGEMERYCKGCETWLPQTEFYASYDKYKGRFKYRIYCKDCCKEQRALQESSMPHEPKTQVCKTCGVEKPIKDFYRNNGNPNGHDTKCKECIAKSAHRNWGKHGVGIFSDEMRRHHQNILDTGFDFITMHVTADGKSDYKYWDRIKQWEQSKEKHAQNVSNANGV